MSQTLRADLTEMLTEQVRYRELLRQLVKRDLLLRYKQTVMGLAWAVFMPLVNTLIFSVIFMRVTQLNVGMPYPLFAFTGVLAWNFFASAMRFSMASLAGNVNLVTKVYFPREVLPFSQVIVCLFDNAVASIVIVALMWWYGITPTIAILWVPVIVAVQVLFVSMAGLLLSMANLFYRDVKYLLDVVLSVAMFTTTALYPAHTMGHGITAKVLYWNPLSVMIDAYRDALFYGLSPLTWRFGITAFLSLAGFLLAWLWFHRGEYAFAESA